MSEAFEGYERQYCEISASLSRKCTEAASIDGEQKKQKVSEVKSGLEEAETLIRKMDLEVRSMESSVKAALLAKLREYKSDLNNLKSDVKRISSSNAKNDTRQELLESGMADAIDLHGVDDNVGKSKKILATISKRMDRNKWIIGCLIVALLLAIILIIYFKLIY
ncbi:hypothetical protein IEQ34_010451 [Dendrobium chrysotoxum]|uniref:Vesicle transport v-SNARE N-terminal domain-containing protein n=1 Tax=Dendrobium chrysotoxum TaxID=161865 RepID=A0AAV7GVQ5_DENCH|nr:hypothetical protein IEQ34_010451 [Dendrobium chrysotoxum]